MWNELLEWFLVVQSPITLSLVCRQFQQIIYSLYDGPPDNLDWLKYKKSNYAYYWPSFTTSACQSVFQCIQDRILQRDYAFLKRVFARNPFYAQLAIGDFFAIEGIEQPFRMPCLFSQLAKRKDLETFALLAQSVKVTCSDGLFVARSVVDQQTGEDYTLFRILLLTAFQQGLPVERSGCTACRRVPGHHRGWTLRAIIAHDDLELLQLYLNQRLRINGQEGGYVLYDSVIVTIWLTNPLPTKIAHFWFESGRTALLTYKQRFQIALNSTPAQLEFALQHGVDLHDVRLLRAVMKRKHPIALLNAYDWNLSKQDRKHIYHKIAHTPKF